MLFQLFLLSLGHNMLSSIWLHSEKKPRRALSPDSDQSILCLHNTVNWIFIFKTFACEMNVSYALNEVKGLR